MFLCFCKVLGKQRNNNIPALLSCGWSGSVRDGGVVLGTTCSHPLLSLTIAIVLQGAPARATTLSAFFFLGFWGGWKVSEIPEAQGSPGPEPKP